MNDINNKQDVTIKEQAIVTNNTNKNEIHNVAQPKTDRQITIVTLPKNPKAPTIADRFEKKLYPIAQDHIPKMKKAEETHIRKIENLKLNCNTFIHQDNVSKRKLLTNSNNINNIKSTYTIPSATITNIHPRVLNMMFYPSTSYDKGLPCNTNLR